MPSINSAGTLVGSILESAGYVYQSAILDELSQPLSSEVGALVYLVGVVVVVFQLAVFRSSKFAPWLLIGPSLFFFVLESRDTIDYARWSFGSHERDQAKVSQGVQSVAGDATPRVSTVFKKYVEMVSDTSRAMVDTISGSQNENDLWMIIKGQAYGLMTTAKGDDPGLRRLIHYGLLGKCSDVIQAARAVDDVTARANSASAVDGAIEESLQYKAPTRQEAADRYARLLNENRHEFSDTDHLVRKYIAQMEGYTGDALDRRSRELIGVPFSCQDIWEIITFGIRDHAKRLQDNIVRRTDELGADADAVLNVLAQASGERSRSQLLSDAQGSSDVAEQLLQVIARYYLRNEVRNPDIGSRLAHFAGRNDLRRIETRMTGSNRYTESARVGAEEWAEKERLIYAAYSLPTYQGLALYFLGLTFPFFALLLLIPGKAQGFLTWFLMWMWVKSWDIGLAIVMQIDTIFWSLYANQKQRFYGSEKLPEDLGAAFASLQVMDPTFQMGGYYAMLAICVLAIPPVTAHFIMGSMKGGASIIAQGAQKYSDFFSDAMLARTEQGIITQLRSDMYQLKETRGLATMMNGTRGRQVLGNRETPPSMGGNYDFRAGSTPSYGKELGSVAAGSASRAERQLARERIKLGIEKGTAIGVSAPSSHGSQLRDSVQYRFRSALPNNVPQELAGAAGLKGQVAEAKGFATPASPLASRPAGMMDSSFKLSTLSERTYGDVVADQKMKTVVSDIASTVAQAGFEADIESQAYALAERMAVFRAIPVPWTNLIDEGSAYEVKRNLARFERKIELLKARVAGASEAHGNFESAYDRAGLAGVGFGAIAFSRLPMKIIDALKIRYDITEGTPEEQEQRLAQLLEQDFAPEELMQMVSDLSTFKEYATEESLRFRDTRDIDYEVMYDDKESGWRRYGDRAGSKRRSNQD